MSDGKQRQNNQAPIKGLLIDIDGVLYTEKQAIKGAVEAIWYLQKHHFPFLLATNTTRRSRYSLRNNLQRLGFKVNLEQIYSAPFAAAQWLKSHQVQTISLFVKGDTYREFKAFRNTTNHPEYLVIGDIGEDLTYEKLNQAFRLVVNGAKMLALQKNRCWQRSTGLSIDTGAIVAALEYATEKKATLIGKPSTAFFEHAVKQLNLPAENVAMIGDDWETDILGSAKAGLQAIAVETGKFKHTPKKRTKQSATVILPSIAELPGYIESRLEVMHTDET